MAKLIASGTPPELAAVVVAEAFAVGAMSVNPQMSRDSHVTSRQETDRLRQQRYRERNATSRDNRDNNVTSRDTSLSKSNSIEEREAESVTSRDTWRPPEPEWSDAVAKLGLPAAESELVKFRERSGPMARILPDWRVWVQRAVDYLAKTKPPQTPPPSTQNGFDWDAVVKTWHRTGFWSPQAGPDPESPACRCPRDIVEKHAILALKATG